MATVGPGSGATQAATPDDPVERSLAVIGLKWALLIVRDLLDGPRRFTEIERSLRRANPKMITARLRELEQAGLLSRTIYAEVPPRVEYALTDRGHALRSVIDALRQWGRAG
jgi:DNA-binding HxlR family transcriptional regulator